MRPISGGKSRVTQQNGKANGHAGNLGGPVKQTNYGADLGPNATNCISGTKVTTKPLSPNANSHSHNAVKGG